MYPTVLFSFHPRRRSPKVRDVHGHPFGSPSNRDRRVQVNSSERTSQFDHPATFSCRRNQIERQGGITRDRPVLRRGREYRVNLHGHIASLVRGAGEKNKEETQRDSNTALEPLYRLPLSVWAMGSRRGIVPRLYSGPRPQPSLSASPFGQTAVKAAKPSISLTRTLWAAGWSAVRHV